MKRRAARRPGRRVVAATTVSRLPMSFPTPIFACPQLNVPRPLTARPAVHASEGAQQRHWSEPIEKRQTRALACSSRISTTRLDGCLGGAVRRRAVVVLWALKRFSARTHPHQPRQGIDVLAPYEPSVTSCGACLRIKPALQHRDPLGELGEDR